VKAEGFEDAAAGAGLSDFATTSGFATAAGLDGVAATAGLVVFAATSGFAVLAGFAVAAEAFLSTSPKILPIEPAIGFPAAVPIVAPAAAAACSVKLWPARFPAAAKLPSRAVTASKRMRFSLNPMLSADPSQSQPEKALAIGANQYQTGPYYRAKTSIH
jgi:hypothetical protein